MKSMRKQLKYGMAIVFVAIALAVQSSSPVYAQVNPACNTTPASDFFDFKPWNACFVNGNVVITQISDLWFIAYPLIEDGIKLAGYLAVGLVIWGGIKYIKSQGNPQELTAARTIILNALIGLAITVLSIVLVQLVSRAFTQI